MRLCLHCDAHHPGESWCCPACGYSPEHISGFAAFAPKFDRVSEGFDPSAFAELASLEEGNFWFVARNRLILWSLCRFFPEARSLLEIGCGTGFVLAGIASKCPELRLAGSEIHTAALNFAADRLPGTQLMQMDARCIPFTDEFDVIGAFDVLEHIPEDEKVLGEMYRALRPGGGIIITVPQHRFLWSQADVFAHHVRRYTATELTSKVTDVGFRILRLTSFVSLLLPMMAVSRLGKRQEGSALDELRMPSLVNMVLGKVMDIERALIKLGLDLPLGGSLLFVAKKPGDASKTSVQRFESRATDLHRNGIGRCGE